MSPENICLTSVSFSSSERMHMIGEIGKKKPMKPLEQHLAYTKCSVNYCFDRVRILNVKLHREP